MKPPLILPCAAWLLLAVLFVSSVSADPQTISKPVVLLISSNGIGAKNEREQRFITQTMLSLEKFRIITITSLQPDFFRVSFSKRLEVIRPLVRKHSAVAALWIEETERNRTLLHLVAFSTGRALVRIVEAQTGPDAALELALASQELLNQAYLLSGKQSGTTDPAVTPPPQDVSPPLRASKPLVSPLRKGYPTYALAAFAAGNGGIHDYSGPPFVFGGGFALELWPFEKLRARATVLFLSGLHRAYDYGTVHPYDLNIELGAGYIFTINRFSIGPAIAVSALWNKLNVSLRTTGHHVHNWWGASVSAAADTRFSLSDTLSLILEPAAAVLPRNREFYLEPERRTIYKTARVGWCIKMGFIVFI